MSTVWELFDLKEQIAIVTGGTGLLGSQICDGLAEAGSHVVVASRNADRVRIKATDLSNRFAKALAIQVDVTAPDSVRSMVARVKEEFGRVNILVNCAHSGSLQAFENTTPEEFELTIRGTLSSTFLCCQAVGQVMKDQRSGSIINIASIYGLVSPDLRIYGKTGRNSTASYGAAKAGIVQLTRWLATYLAPHRVRVNCLVPGGFYNPKLKDRPDYDTVFVPSYCSRTPLGRMGGEDDLKGAVVYLASCASAYVTGQNLVVDGGWTTW